MATPPVGSTLFDGIQFGNPNEIEAMLLTYGAVRSGVLEEAVRIDNADQTARNQRINDLNRFNAVLQRARPQSDTLGSRVDLSPVEATEIRQLVTADFDAVIDTRFAGNPPTLQFTLKVNGGFQQLLNAVRNQVDQASANSQLELISLQALINRRNQAVEFTTNLVQRFSSLRDRIIGNIRN